MELHAEGKFSQNETNKVCYIIEEFEQQLCLEQPYHAPCLFIYAYFIKLLLATEQPFLGRQYCSKALEVFGFSLGQIMQGFFDPSILITFRGERQTQVGPHENMFYYCF